MNKKKSKFIMMFICPIVSFLFLGIFLVFNVTDNVVLAFNQKGGGIYVANNKKSPNAKAGTDFCGGLISGFTAEEGGGVYVDTNGIFNLKGKKENETSFDDLVRYDSNGEESSDGEYVYLGSYPKTVATQAELESIDTNYTDDDGYYHDENGNRYERVIADPFGFANPIFNNGETIVSGRFYYFKIEPIKWRIITEESGGVLLLCEEIIDMMPYWLNSNSKNNNYLFSDIRAWLNAYTSGNSGGESWYVDGFFKKAFTVEEQELISTTEVDNSASTTDTSSNSYTCGNTNDKIFLLSYQDMINTEYGFDSSNSEYDTERQKQTTDYSRAKGVWFNTGNGNGYWWLRSPSSTDRGSSFLLTESGNISSFDVADKTVGVVPALHIERKSKISGNTATSGNGHNIYNAGIFTMTGGVVGINGSSQTGYGIYNTGTMNLYGGIIYNNIYSETSFNLKTNAEIKGSITLGDNATINVVDYDENSTLQYKINISNAYGGKQILTINTTDISTVPDLSQIEILWDSDNYYYLKAIQGSSELEWSIVLVECYYVSLTNQTTNFTFNEYNNGGTWETLDRTGNGESVFTTVSTTNYGGPYIMGLTNYMADGEKYRIFLKLKTSTSTWLQIHFEAGGKSISVKTTSQYQEYFIDVTYNASSTYSSLCIYSSNWIGQTISIKDICVKRISEYGQTYGDLPNLSFKYGIADDEVREIGSWYAKFNGTSDFINFGRKYMYSDKISVHLSAFSENWADVVNQRLISCTEYGGFCIEGASAGSECVVFAAYDKGVGYKQAYSSVKWADLAKGWHDFDLIFDGTYLYGYVDGVKIATSPAFSSGELEYNPTNSIFVGAEPSSDQYVPYNQYFKGYIGNVVISNSSILLSSNALTWSVPKQNIELYAFFEGSDAVLSCGHFVYDTDRLGSQIVVSDGSLGHHVESNYKCSICGKEEYVSSLEIISHSYGAGTDSYVWVDDNQHCTKTTKTCSWCGYVLETINNDKENHSFQTTISKVKVNDTQHKIVTENYCLICHQSKITEIYENHNLTTNIETISDGVSGHHTKTTITCNVCSYSDSQESAVVAHTIENVSYYTADATYHYLNTYDKCSVCSYKTDVVVGAGEKHLMKNGVCFTCKYDENSGSIFGFTTTKTLSLNEDESCLLCEPKYVFIDDEKQKYLLYFRRRYDDKKEYIAKMFEI